jgi:chromosomal replication initiation ATPase DnaA
VDPLAALWKSALGQLKLELPKGVFETHLLQTSLTRAPDGAYVVWATTLGSADWLRDRLSGTITRVLRERAGLGHDFGLRFES